MICPTCRGDVDLDGVCRVCNGEIAAARIWFALPKHLRDKIWATYVPGQEKTMTPSAAYLAAAEEVDQWIRENHPGNAR